MPAPCDPPPAQSAGGPSPGDPGEVHALLGDPNPDSEQASANGNDQALRAIAERFDLPAAVAAIQPLGQGNVNSTYRVTLQATGDARPQAMVLQRLNTAVFRQPRWVMANIQRVTRHIRQRLALEAPQGDHGWRTPEVVASRGGGDPWQEIDAGFWRMLTFLDGCDTLERVERPDQARELGRGLGTFHRLISDLPVDDLADTLEGFHVTPGYLRQFEAVLADPRPRPIPGSASVAAGDLEWALAFVRQRRGIVSVLEEARRDGRLRPRPIHGDPKVNNVLLDQASGQAVALIDLDTVKPGLIHYDIGDCLRSAANPLGEETADWRQVRFDPELGAAVLAGYGAVASDDLSADDRELVFDAVRLIAFELGLRFLSDHLAGDVYFRCEAPGHNLRRALVQFQLTASIEAQEEAIRTAAAAMG